MANGHSPNVRVGHILCLSLAFTFQYAQGASIKRSLAPLSADTLSALHDQHTFSRKGRLQIGIRRGLEHEVAIPDQTGWQRASNGTWYCLIEIESTGARGLRVHLEGLQLSGDGDILIYNPDRPDERVQRIASADLPNSKELWTESQFSERVSILCEAVTERDIESFRVKISEISHIFALPNVKSFKDGTCENDVTCFPEWAQEAAAVARMIYVDRGSAFVCTGCLLATTRPSARDYFLTARHCITSQTVASTVELYWLYQTSTCNGAAPDLNSVPHTSGGGSLLASGLASDFAFMRLGQRAPAKAYHATWTTASLNQGDFAVTIHHPQGTFKCISAGNIVGSAEDFWDVQWFSGVTEPGSSGSPLFNGNHEFVGQLTGGFNGPGSSCDNPSAPDEYGRFDITYESIKSWIGRGVSTNGFRPAKEGFSGLYLVSGDEANPISSGAILLRITGKGKFSGKLISASGNLSFRGELDGNGAAKAHASRGGSSGLDLQFQIDTATHDNLRGTVTDGGWIAELAGQKIVFNGRTNEAPEAGKYTFAIEGNPGSPSEPGGAGFGVVTVDKNGKVKGMGSLADGTKVTFSSDVSSTGVSPWFIPLYSGNGCAAGWFSFQSSDTEDDGGDINWSKTAMPNAKLYPGGFLVRRHLSANRYAAPVRGTAILSLASSQVVFEAADLQQSITEPIALGANNRVNDLGSNKLSLVFKSGIGTFSGKITDQLTGMVRAYSGAVLQKQNTGSGYFTEGAQSGRVTVE